MLFTPRRIPVARVTQDCPKGLILLNGGLDWWFGGFFPQASNLNERNHLQISIANHLVRAETVEHGGCLPSFSGLVSKWQEASKSRIPFYAFECHLTRCLTRPHHMGRLGPILPLALPCFSFPLAPAFSFVLSAGIRFPRPGFRGARRSSRRP